jgi:small-conductance mechanosensitive channel
MSNFYDDDKFGVINRKWFGLTKKHGGDAANGYTFGTTDATVQSHLARWYPKGPIKILKVGHRVLATISAATDADRIVGKLLTRGGSASVAATWDLQDATAPFAVGSKESITVKQCKAGEYISIKTGTPETVNGTQTNTATQEGSVAFFIDYAPMFDNSGKWDVNV